MNARPALPLAALAVVALAASSARAQNFSISVLATEPAMANLSAADCVKATTDDDIAFSWTVPITVVGTMQESVFLSKSESCTLEADQSPLVDHPRTQANGVPTNYPIEGKDPLRVSDIFNFLSKSGTCESLGAVEQTVYVCVKVVADNIGQAATHLGKLAIRVDTKAPPVPTDVKAVPLDSGLDVSWGMTSGVGDAKGYRVFVDGKLSSTVAGADVREVSLDGLTNGTTYAVTVTSIDSAGSTSDRYNESAVSAPVQATPLDAEDFFERYRRLGGTETGGCDTTGTASLALVALGLLLARRRRGFAALALLAAMAAPASAQGRFNETPRAYTFTLQTGSFSPNIDGEFSGVTPFKDVFGSDSPLLWRAALDFDLLSTFGRLSLGVSGGFWQAVGKSRYPQKGDTVANDTVLFNLWPITPTLTYRLDQVLAVGIPLVPYAKLGYGFARWETGGSTTSVAGGVAGSGWARGLEIGGGLALSLDIFEPGKAAELDQDFGINSTALYFDATQTWWHGNGAKGLMLDGTSLGGGILFAF